jgi:hypothetical protein
MTEKPKRLAPTQDTVRQIYLLSGNQCAFPECNHPIILQDGSYIGELCHICAAEPGGERFEVGQSNEDRRAVENLLLMCHDHHVVTNNVEFYPVSRMREIKAAHESRFKQGLAAMMESASVQIIDSIVSLGGLGGTAPGAGGGGGGAIGPGARGGDGGQGGELSQAKFKIHEDMVAINVHVGKGGKGGREEQSGGNGEDTFVEAVYSDGTIEELLRAKGGKGGASGAGRAIVTTSMLANSAEICDGLIFVIAGGWQRYYVDSMPYAGEFAVVFVAEPDGKEIGTITTTVFDPKGNELVTLDQQFDFSRGSVPSVIKVRVPIDQLGTWMVLLSSNDGELRRLPFEVVMQPQN